MTNNKKKRYQKYISANKFDKNCANTSKKILKRLKIKKIDNVIEEAVNYHNEKMDRMIYFTSINDFIIKITLNYIRHKLTNYDNILLNFNGGREYNREQFKQDTNKLILEKYNNFREEEFI